MSIVDFQVELSETNRQLKRIADSLELLIPAKPTRVDVQEKVSLADVSYVDPVRSEVERISNIMNPQRRYELAARTRRYAGTGTVASAARESEIIGTSNIGRFDADDPLDLPDWLARETEEGEDLSAGQLGNSVGVP
jgi:nicotinic acid phosphoribosyltransferase